jgi:hypothetical protein
LKRILRGDVRLFFPRPRLGPRPNLSHSVLVSADGAEIPLEVSQKTLSKAAIKLDFASRKSVADDALDSISRIRFVCDDQTRLDCPFLISLE